MKKRILALATSAVLAFSLVFSASADTVVFQSTADDFQAMVDNDGGETGGGDYFTKAGEPGYNAYDGKVNVYGRQNAWDTVDFKLGKLEVGKTYKLEVTFSAKEAVTFTIEDADSPWQVLATSDPGVTEAVVVYEFTTVAGSGDLPVLTEASAQNRLRLKATEGFDYFVENVVLYEVGGGAAAAEEAPAAGDTAVAGNDKASADTGIEGVAIIAGLALVATGAVVISRKRK